MTYAPTEFEVTTSKALGMKHLQQKSNVLDNISCDLDPKVTQNVVQYPLHPVTYPATKFEVAMSNSLGGEDAFTRKDIIGSLTLTLRSRSNKMLPSALYIM